MSEPIDRNALVMGLAALVMADAAELFASAVHAQANGGPMRFDPHSYFAGGTSADRLRAMLNQQEGA